MKNRKSGKLISIVIPCYNEAGNIATLTKKVTNQLKKRNWEIIYIDDGSKDSTLLKIKSASKKNKRIRYISLTRNFGHQSALRAGLDVARGDCVISMDADLQHPPKLIPKLISKWEEGYDVVETSRRDKANSASYFKRLTSRWFYWLMKTFSNINLVNGSADFRLLDRKVVERIKELEEVTFFLRGLIVWMGYPRTIVPYTSRKRHKGKTKYTFVRMLSVAFDAITSFSVFPLRIATIAGILMSLASGLYGIYAIFTWIFNGRVIVGWGSVIVSILFIGGLQLVILGIIGEYIGKIFMETKKRPLYIIKDSSFNVGGTDE